MSEDHGERRRVGDNEVDAALRRMFSALEGPPLPLEHVRKRAMRRRVMLVAAALALAGIATGVATALVGGSPTVSRMVAGCAPSIQVGDRLYAPDGGSSLSGVGLSKAHVIGQGTFPSPACQGVVTRSWSGSTTTTTTEPQEPGQSVEIYSIEGVRPELAVTVASAGELGTFSDRVWIRGSRCLDIPVETCLQQSVEFDGQTYAPARPSNIPPTFVTSVGSGQFTDAGNTSTVSVYQLPGVSPSDAIAVSGVADRIFISDNACAPDTSVVGFCLH